MPPGRAAADSVAGAPPCQPPGNVGEVGAEKLLAGRTKLLDAAASLRTPPPAPPRLPSAPTPPSDGPIAPAASGASAAAVCAFAPIIDLLSGQSMPESICGACPSIGGSCPPIWVICPNEDPSWPNTPPSWPTIEPIIPSEDDEPPPTVASPACVIVFALTCRALWLPSLAAACATP